jgi:hypothetical protein
LDLHRIIVLAPQTGAIGGPARIFHMECGDAFRELDDSVMLLNQPEDRKGSLLIDNVQEPEAADAYSALDDVGFNDVNVSAR